MNKDVSIQLRNLSISDYDDLKDVMIRAYKGLEGSYWKEHHIKNLLQLFPEGQICVTVNGKLAAAALSIIVDYKLFGDSHTYKQITGNYTFCTHTEKGDVLYGIDVFVDPDYRGLRLGRRLYDARKELCENLNLKAIIAGGRLPNYNLHAAQFTPKEYIEKVKLKEVFDPVLSFQLSNDFHVKKVLTGYLEGDKDSKEFASLLEWNNIYYQEKEELISSKKSVVRVGIVQWQMRAFDSMSSLMRQAEYFVDAVSNYKSDFALFPELFNSPLMLDFNHLSEADAIRAIALYTEPMRKQFSELAIGYNVNIITGSMPLVEDGKLFNVGYVCRRDGSYEEFRKIHITPSERRDWGMIGGDKLQVIDTDCGKIGVLICYDSEFPELSRKLALEGMKILFVPFLTDSQNGYNRVRRCSQARAVENECYVVIGGSVGNLPQVSNMDINYAQSAVFTPSDFAFPSNAIKGEATPNTEMTLIVDLDLELLMELHAHGSVHTLKDRRTDLYEIIWKNKN